MNNSNFVPIEKTHSMLTEMADVATSSEDYARRFSGKIGEFFLNVQAKITLNLLKSYPKASILDVGGGHAQLAVPLVNKGFKVTVAGSADICRERLDMFLTPNSFEYYTCDLLKLPFKENHFDVVLAFRLLSHVDQWQEFIAEICRISRRAVIIDYPDIRSFNIMYRLLFSAKKSIEGNTRPFRLFKREEVLREFRKHDYAVHIFKPEFFIPMVIHRALKSLTITHILESISRTLGLTYLFGSPIILSVANLKDNQN